MALPKVVLIRLCISSAEDICWSVAFRWEAVRPIFRILFPWFISVLGTRYWVPSTRRPKPCAACTAPPYPLVHVAVALDIHAEAQAALVEDLDELQQGLAAEVAELEHLALLPTHEVADGLDGRGPEAVLRADREVEVVDRLAQDRADALHFGVDLRLLGVLTGRGVALDEQADVIPEDRGGVREG